MILQWRAHHSFWLDFDNEIGIPKVLHTTETMLRMRFLAIYVEFRGDFLVGNSDDDGYWVRLIVLLLRVVDNASGYMVRYAGDGGGGAVS